MPKLAGRLSVSAESPENEPVVLLPLTEVDVKLALPAYVVPSTVPVRLPFHLIVSVADAPVVDNVLQLSGVVANDPVAVPLVMVTALLLVVHLESFPPATREELVPPPDAVSGGENDTFADSEQATEPGAAPENFGGFGV